MRWRSPLLGVLLFATVCAANANDADVEALTTRTVVPEPSPGLTQALGLDVAPWHKPGAKMEHVKLPPDSLRRSAEAALQALNALDPAVPQNDFDRAWVAFERAAALRDAGHSDDARAAFEQVLGMPRTKAQDRLVRVALHDLGESQQSGLCPPSHLSSTHTALGYPKFAAAHGIEGWVEVWMDVESGGQIVYVFVNSSSARAFEAPAVEWVAAQRVSPTENAPLDRPCTASVTVRFKMRSASGTRFSSDLITDEAAFTYRSISAAIRVRAEAYESVLQQRANAP